MIEDPYRVLEVGAEATDAEIRRAFRRLARQLHPDLNPDDDSSAARFRLVSEAYRVLLDPRERAQADRSGATAMPPDAGATASVFQESGRKWARNGQDVVAVAKIDLVTSIGGGPVQVRVTGPVTCTVCAGSGYDPDGSVVTCWTCDGSGQVTFTNRMGESTGICLTCGGEGRQASQECGACAGHGTVVGERLVDVTLPPAVDEGDMVTVTGAGGPGGRGGRPGDLLVFVTIDPHPVFTRSGLDLRVTIPITFTEAALGATVAVPTFDTPLSVAVPPGTQGGTVLAVEGRGVRTADGTTGRLLITLNIGVPTDLIEDDRGSLESLTGTFGPDLRSILFGEMQD